MSKDFVLLILIVEFFKLDPNGADGVEKINRFLFFIPIPLLFIGGPGFLFAALLDLPFFRFFNFGNTPLTCIYAILIFSVGFISLYAALLMCYVIIINTNSTSKWIQKFHETW